MIGDKIRYNDRVLYNTAYRLYGNSININIKYLGVVLDMIIPCTFGIITLTLTKTYGKYYKYRY